MPLTEADTCRIYVLPKLYEAGWTDEQIDEQHTFTDGRVNPASRRAPRGPQKRADYRLRYTRDFPIAIVEANSSRPATPCPTSRSTTIRSSRSTAWSRRSSRASGASC